MLVAEPDRVGHAQFERSHHRDAAGQPVPGHRGYRVDNTADGTISGYAVNLRTGGLSAEPGSTARTVLHPEAIAVAPDGKNVYVISENDGVLSQFGIDPGTGKITPPCHRLPSRCRPAVRSAWRSPRTPAYPRG